MKVRNILNHYSMASNGRVFVEVEGERKELTRDELKHTEWSEEQFMFFTVGMIKVIDNDLIITAYKK